MSGTRTGIFAEWAPVYRNLGLEPRPVKPGHKACKITGWTKPDADHSPAELESWISKYAAYGIGLLMGTALPDGGQLGALDIDRDEYRRLGEALLRNPSCGRFGSKGAVFFVRVLGDPGNASFKAKGEFADKYGQVAECLFKRKFCVIPPTIHPQTNKPYYWIGTPLHELDFDLLPVIGE